MRLPVGEALPLACIEPLLSTMEAIDSIEILGKLKTEKLVSVPVGTVKAVKRGQKHTMMCGPQTH